MESTADVMLTKPPMFGSGCYFLWSLQEKRRADERTRTALLLITSLLAYVLTRPSASGSCAYLCGFR
jgi:hypothetical protein